MFRGGQDSTTVQPKNAEISHDGQDITTVQPKNVEISDDVQDSRTVQTKNYHGHFFHNTEEAATTNDNMDEAETTNNAINNIDDSVRYAVNVLVHNAVEVKFSLPPLYLPVVMPYLGEPTATTAS